MKKNPLYISDLEYEELGRYFADLLGVAYQYKKDYVRLGEKLDSTIQKVYLEGYKDAERIN